MKRGPCAVCGHRWVHYLDRSGTDPEKKLCRKCFSRLVAKETMSFTTLPGVVEVDYLVRVHADVGRCKVCGQGRIEWIDKERGVYLCELCRDREMKGRTSM